MVAKSCVPTEEIRDRRALVRERKAARQETDRPQKQKWIHVNFEMREMSNLQLKHLLQTIVDQ